MRKLKKIIFGVLIVLVISAVAFLIWLSNYYVVPILTYHRVNNAVKNSLTVSPASFERQMRFLKEHGYKVISFEDFVESIKNSEPLARNSVVIHFDDGFEDNFTYAFPVLRKYGFPAMVFLVSDSIGTKDFLSWDQVREMENHDFESGAHTRHHSFLPSLKTDDKWDEIAGSKRMIEEQLGHPILYFAYPSGGFDKEAKLMAQEAGFEAAVTTNRGADRLNKDLFEINRIRIKDTDTNFILFIKLSGYYNFFRACKNKEMKQDFYSLESVK